MYTPLNPHLYKLKDFIDPEKLSFKFLAQNPLAIDYLEQKIIEHQGKLPGMGSWSALSKNPNGIRILEKYPEKIDWDHLSGNPQGVWLIRRYLEKKIFRRPKVSEKYEMRAVHEINGYKLSANPEAIPLLEKYPKERNIRGLCMNPNAMPLIQEMFANHITPDWSRLTANPNPEAIAFLEKHAHPKWYEYGGYLAMNPVAIHLLEKEPGKIDNWAHLCLNPKALPLLEANPDKICWSLLSRQPFAIPLLEKHLDQVVWDQLCVNPAAVPLLEANPEKVLWENIMMNPAAVGLIQRHLDKMNPYCWTLLSANPGIFELDYQALKKRADIYKEELVAAAMHPRRIARMMEQTGGELDGFI